MAHNLALDVMYIGSHSTHLGLSGSASLARTTFLRAILAWDLDFWLRAHSCTTCTQPYPDFASQLGASATVAQALKTLSAVHVCGDRCGALAGRQGALRLDAGQVDEADVLWAQRTRILYLVEEHDKRRGCRGVRPMPVRLVQSSSIQGRIRSRSTRKTRRQSLAPAFRTSCRSAKDGPS